jgi:hypothetical protein
VLAVTFNLGQHAFALGTATAFAERAQGPVARSKTAGSKPPRQAANHHHRAAAAILRYETIVDRTAKGDPVGRRL